VYHQRVITSSALEMIQRVEEDCVQDQSSSINYYLLPVTVFVAVPALVIRGWSSATSSFY